MNDLYETLGVSKNAAGDEIKKAYRDAAFKYHPDRNPGNKSAEDKFKQISAAYSVLGDETKRADYDRFGSADAYAQAAQQAYNQNPYGPNPFGDGFWEWYAEAMGAASQNQYKNTAYQRTYRYSSSNYKEQTKKEAFSSLIRYMLTTLAGIFFFRFSIILLPFGPILCLVAIINGVSGSIRSIQTLLKPRSK